MISKGSWYIYFISTAASIANFFQGFDAGLYSIIISDVAFGKYFKLTAAKEGAVQSIVNAGTVIGNLFISWWFIEYFGRKKSFWLGTSIVIIAIALQAGAVDFAMIIIGRLLAGIGTAIIGTNLAAYLSEVATASLRGRMVSFVQLSYQVGTLIAYCAGLGTSKISGNNSWRTATAIQIPVGIVLIVVSFIIPESPRWRLEKYPNEPQRALKDLSKIRCLPPDNDALREEFGDMLNAHAYYQSIGKITWKSFFSSYSTWKRIAFAMATMAMGQISGVGALLIYGVLIFESLNLGDHSLSLLLNVASGLLCLAACFITFAGVDRWGRKITIIVGLGINVFSYIVLGALSDRYGTSNKSASIVCVIFIYVIEMSYSGGLGPTAWIYASELFPTQLRDKGVNIAQSGQQLTTLWVNQTWPVIFDGQIGHNGYWLICGFNAIGLVVVILFWPETKGVSLEHMNRIFGETDAATAGLEKGEVELIEDVAATKI